MWNTTTKADCVPGLNTATALEGKWTTTMTDGKGNNFYWTIEFSDDRMIFSQDCRGLTATVSTRIKLTNSTIEFLEQKERETKDDNGDSCSVSVTPGTTTNYEFYGQCLKLTNQNDPNDEPLYLLRGF